MNLACGQGGLKLEINIPPQHILAKSKGGLIIEGGVSLSEYGINETNYTYSIISPPPPPPILVAKPNQQKGGGVISSEYST